MIHKERKLVKEYTVERCTKCGTQRQRRFSAGDILFDVSGRCASCDGAVRIERIFGETILY